MGRVEDVLHGAALMTGTEVEVLADSHTNEMPARSDGLLLAARARSQRERGRGPLPPGVLTETLTAGTDFGNVSQRVPGIHPLISVSQGQEVALHTREMAKSCTSVCRRGAGPVAGPRQVAEVEGRVPGSGARDAGPLCPVRLSGETTLRG